MGAGVSGMDMGNQVPSVEGQMVGEGENDYMPTGHWDTPKNRVLHTQSSVKTLQHALTMLLQMALFFFKANRNLSQCRGGGWVEITVQCCLVCEALGLIPSQIPHPNPSPKK